MRIWSTWLRILKNQNSTQIHRFLQYMENINLTRDSISNLRQFYECIRLEFHSSFTKATDILPQFRDISPNYPFRHILVPQNTYYIWYHSIITRTDTKMISPRLSPLASRLIATERTETNYWNLLYIAPYVPVIHHLVGKEMILSPKHPIFISTMTKISTNFMNK